MEKRNKGPLPKQLFPALLNSALNEVTNMQQNIFSDRQQVLKRLPKKRPLGDDNNPNNWTAALTDIFQETRQL